MNKKKGINLRKSPLKNLILKIKKVLRQMNQIFWKKRMIELVQMILISSKLNRFCPMHNMKLKRLKIILMKKGGINKFKIL